MAIPVRNHMSFKLKCNHDTVVVADSIGCQKVLSWCFEADVGLINSSR